MDMKYYMGQDPNEKPLDVIVDDGGFCSVFRTLGCIGDSLASGEFVSRDAEGKAGFHDYYEYSWGQYIARAAGLKAYNFSKGGMTAKRYYTEWAEENGFWSPDLLCQGYIMALGVNDILNQNQPLGSIDDIDAVEAGNVPDTFAGYYYAIIHRIREMQPKARFFLMTMPNSRRTIEKSDLHDRHEAHAELLRAMAEKLEFTYVIDLARYAPDYDAEFIRHFYLDNHMSPAGYLFSAKIISSYIDYIIRHNPEDFAQVGFIGTPYHNPTAKW